MSLLSNMHRRCSKDSCNKCMDRFHRGLSPSHVSSTIQVYYIVRIFCWSVYGKMDVRTCYPLRKLVQSRT